MKSSKCHSVHGGLEISIMLCHVQHKPTGSPSRPPPWTPFLESMKSLRSFRERSEKQNPHITSVERLCSATRCVTQFSVGLPSERSARNAILGHCPFLLSHYFWMNCNESIAKRTICARSDDSCLSTVWHTSQATGPEFSMARF